MTMKHVGTLLFVALILSSLVLAQPKAAQVVSFQVQPEDGSAPVTIRLQATHKVSPEYLKFLQQSIRVYRMDRVKKAERSLYGDKDKGARLNFDQAEIQVDVSARDGSRWAWSWPDTFRFVRPGVIEVAQPLRIENKPRMEDVSVIRQALHGAPHVAVGTLLCQGERVPFVKVAIVGHGAETQADGTFRIEHEFVGVPSTMFIAFEGSAGIGTLRIPVQIFDDLHATRSERVDQDPVVTGETADFGSIEVPGTDCRLWRHGVEALRRYADIMGTAPPAGKLWIKRWAAVPLSVGAPHTYYDYIVAPTDLAETSRARRTIFHEFGHTVAFVADGQKPHWDWDNTRFIYARKHNDTTVMNKAPAFIEGWANYWSAATARASIGDNSGLPDAFLDFNENKIAIRLMAMANEVRSPVPGCPSGEPVAHCFMAKLFIDNPGQLHTLQQFEERYCTTAPTPNRFCTDGRSVRSAPSCPPGYHDDGLTCRLVNILAKPSQGRGVGVVPNSCGAGNEFDAGLCYARCPVGFHGVGPACWQSCPAGYHDDGATCRRDGSIIGADNSACPWYDKCGLVTARGCSVCPASYSNDGCTCRKDPHIFGKISQGRGVGTVPNGCTAGQQMDAGLCYATCPPGFNGAGPVCWGRCPAGFDDHGATCYRAPHIFSDDPVIPP